VSSPAPGDRYSRIYGLEGSSFDDRLTGSKVANVLRGGSGGVVVGVREVGGQPGGRRGVTGEVVALAARQPVGTGITGSDVANFLQGLDGNDLLMGGGGDDRLDGGAGGCRCS
jgi:Ca2+-binding RTX toxin-like protein